MRNTTLSTHFRSTISSIIFPGPLDVETVIHAICLKLATTGMKPPAECGKYRVVFPPTNFTKTEDSFFCILGVSKLNRILLPALFCLILAAALLGNSLVLTTIVLSKMTWTTMHILTVSLAISDIFLGVTCIPLSIGQTLTTEWLFGRAACQLVPFFMQVTKTSGVLTLCCMAGERFLAIVYPLKVGSLQSTRRSLVLLVVVWVVAFGAAVPYVCYYETRKICSGRLPSGRCYEHTICSAKEGSSLATVYLHWFTYLILFIFPAFVLCLAYGIIIYKLWIKGPVGVIVTSDAGFRARFKKKAIKMLGLVVILFLVCWTPLLTFDLVVKVDGHIHVSSTLIHVKYYLQCLALSSTAYNPIIYTFLNQKFRNSFKSLLQRRSGRVGPLAINRKELCNSDGTKMGIIKCAKSTAKTDITPAPMTRFTLYKSRC